jgi:2-oxoglutarate dehydrogenase E1 component
MDYLTRANESYIEELLKEYTKDRHCIDPSWSYFFDGVSLGSQAPLSHPEVAPADELEPRVMKLIEAYRCLGGTTAHLCPLTVPSPNPLLELSQFQIPQEALSRVFQASRSIGMQPSSLREIIARLKDLYCSFVWMEWTHVRNPEERNWLQQKIELFFHSEQRKKSLDDPTRLWILKRLIQAESFERFLHTRYVAQKRFSLEGNESLLPALDSILESAQADHIVLGMAHRGRLNVLVHLLQKPLESLLTEFEAKYSVDPSEKDIEGDVKYHMGFSTFRKTRQGREVHVSMASNPSHLEFVYPVMEGMTRAYQKHFRDNDRSQVIPIAIHGDAALAGQGICYETLNLSRIPAYTTGGTIHLVINNQIGFTTSPTDSRSTGHCTDIARFVDAPIFHVNADQPELVWQVAQLCTEYRQKFKKDVFLDLVGYRKYGHNEGDEPAFTQPLLYQKIRSQPSVVESYSKALIAEKKTSTQETAKLVEVEMERLTQAQVNTRAENPKPSVSTFEGRWKEFHRPSRKDFFTKVSTQVESSRLRNLVSKLSQVPEGFKMHPKLLRLHEARQESLEKSLDWATGEALAFATLLEEGRSIRLSGQDSQRGTFSHRHCVFHDVQSGKTYTPLNHLTETQGFYEGINSTLSESGVLGFEYGFSVVLPEDLVIWEAQFGDFCNGAQVILDQFLASGEFKWQRMSGLTLFLPHGYEGQGPEHSSARLERFLQLCAKDNMSVMHLTTPAQLFHALRRQALRRFRRPLILMSPKSLLRHPQVLSTLSDLSEAEFQEVLDSDLTQEEKNRVKKVLLCSGKVYYDLLAGRKDPSVALIRVEQLYPWPLERLRTVLKQYPQASFFWVQEESRNMGAWSFVLRLWREGEEDQKPIMEYLQREIEYIGRKASVAPAVGSRLMHDYEQKTLVKEAFL